MLLIFWLPAIVSIEFIILPFSMAYLALARKWRPKRFAEVVGQTHVVQALSNALDSGRVHHAFLFTGTRGVGKTTLARIFAKSLNCEQGTSAEPCQQCGTCQSIDEGRFVDLIEVDAASRTKVEDTRELLENVHYAPTSGNYKIYLIDEVHMLSGHSFNALLKTLEEPPEHVKFLFATTDPQKMPVTVLSRCLQFNLRAMRPEQIENQLHKILVAEEIQFEQAALGLLAKAADGSMRDGLSLLDQAIAQGSDGVKTAAIESMLGTIKSEHTQAIISALLERDADVVLNVVADMADHAVDFASALDEVLMQLHQISILHVAPTAFGNSDAPTPWLKQIAESLSPEQLQLFYQIGLHSKRDIDLAPSLRVGFEMAMLRMLAFELSNGPSLGSNQVESQSEASASASVSSSSQPTLASTSSQSTLASTESPTVLSQPESASSASKSVEAASDVAVASTPTQASTNSATPAAPQAPSSAVSAPPNYAHTQNPPVPKIDDSNASPANEAKQQDQPSSVAITLAGNNEWGELIEQTGIQGFIRELAMNCACERLGEHTIELALLPSLKYLYKPERLEQVEKAVGEQLRRAIKIELEFEESDKETPTECLQRLGHEQFEQTKQSLQNDPGVKAIISEFGATLNENSIKPG